MALKRLCLVLVSLLLVNGLSAQQVQPDNGEQQWVDSVFRSLTLDERIGQLFMVAAYSNQGTSHQQGIEKLIKRFNIGGLIFMQGGPVRQALLTNRYQSMAKTPMLIAMDAEWGLGMRLDSTISYPRQMTLGAIRDDHQIYLMGQEIGKQMNRLGVHINFAPVIDINSNSANPVIGTRSFGEDKYNVASKGVAYMKGLESQGIMANAKHFPGHGDTSTDSHHTLPLINHDQNRLEEVELYPFKRLIGAGLRSTMIAHLYIPALDATPNLPSTLSKPVVSGLLRDNLQFDGLIFTDALNMKGVTKYFPAGEIGVRALSAGNDVLLFPVDVSTGIKAIKQALEDKQLKRKELDEKVRKILRTKYRAGLNQYKAINTDNLYRFLNRPKAKLVKQALFEKAVTVVANQHQAIPIKVLDTTYFASLTIGTPAPNAFQKKLSKYAPFSHFTIDKNQRNKTQYQQLLDKLENFSQIIVGLHMLNNSRSKNYGLTSADIEFLKSLQERTKIIVVAFGNPYSLERLEDINILVCAYQDQIATQQLVPQVIFGALPADGRLPVSAGKYKVGTGQVTASVGRLGYSLPEHAGMDSRVLSRIDRIAAEAISDRATPGCQVLVARNGKIVFEKEYGYFTYDSLNMVTDETLYDIASITKVVATLQAVMFLQEHGDLDLNQKASYYLPELKESNKNNIMVKDLLTHQAGLLPFIPFWRRTVDDVGLNPTIYSSYPEQNFQMQVALGVYSIGSLQDSIWNWTIESKLRPRRYRRGARFTYKYSDMGFYILKKLAENHLNQPMEKFLEQNFYQPLGLSTMTYLPLCKFPIDRIAPTEVDNYFRNTLICGTVHDQGAAMFGGIAGHAGIFSNASDLAILAQMNLQDGYYGGTRYLQEGTIQKFTTQQSSRNRRGLGWDKPERNGKINPTSRYASAKAFGHTGFTGTAVWVDPEFDLVYVFLSNRIHPKANNSKLNKSNIRTRIQDAIYESMWSYRKGNNS